MTTLDSIRSFALSYLAIVRPAVEKVAWCRTGDRLLSQPIVASFIVTKMNHSTSVR